MYEIGQEVKHRFHGWGVIIGGRGIFGDYLIEFTHEGCTKTFLHSCSEDNIVEVG